MSTLLDGLLADLVAEGDALRGLVADLPSGDAGWRRPTPAAGWTVGHQVAHLAWTDEAATLAALDPGGWEALVRSAAADPDGFVDAGAAAIATTLPPAELLGRWDDSREALAHALRSLPEGRRMPWFGPPMSAASMVTARLMETWAHGLDVREALGLPPEGTARLRHVAHLGVRTRDFAYAARGLAPPTAPFRVELSPPAAARDDDADEVWAWGPEDAADRVTGSALDFCRLVTQRVHRDDTDLVAGGDEAALWLMMAQCFAGPVGAGRAARG